MDEHEMLLAWGQDQLLLIGSHAPIRMRVFKNRASDCYVFSAECDRCRKRWAYQVAVQVLRRDQYESALHKALGKLRTRIEDYPCITPLQRAGYAEAITRALAKAGPLTHRALYAWVPYEEKVLYSVARELDFLRTDGLYGLPPEHPLWEETR